MTITTTQQINPAVLQAELDALASGSAFTSRGAPLDTIADKTIEAHGATDAQLQQAITTAAGKFVDYTALAAKGVTGLQTLLGQQSALTTQLNADIATVTNAGGWHGVSVADQDAIMLRILNGFGTVMTAIVDHLNVTGAAR